MMPIEPRPRRIAVATSQRHDRQIPTRLRLPGAGEMELLTAVGPEQVSASVNIGARHAREYYTCLTDNGLSVLLYRDVLTDAWYLHGWLD